MTAAILKAGPDADEYTWGPGSRAFAAYDTMEENLRLGLGNEYGICTVCEGNRRRQECTCLDWAMWQVEVGERRAELKAVASGVPHAPHGVVEFEG